MSVSQTRYSNVLVLLLSCAPGPPTPLSILVRARIQFALFCERSSTQRCMRSSVYWQLLAWNSLISQNKNRLKSFRRKVFVSGHFEPVIEPTNAVAPDTQLV